MNDKQGYIPQLQRKKILFIADDIRTTSGVAGVAREIVIGTAHRYNYAIIGGGINHPDAGKALDLSADTNHFAEINDSYIKLFPTNGYGNVELVRTLVQLEKPDAIMFFTDPRYYVWLFQAENEFRTKIPFIYINIWDDLPAPYYNLPFYESCDTMFAISKQTLNINRIVLGKKAKDKKLKYFPHGINPKFFFPIDEKHEKYQDFINYKKKVLNNKEYDFILFYNSRNIRRKCTSDIILAYKIFCDKIGKEKASKCALLLHTQPVDEFGTDLNAVKELLDNNDNINLIFSEHRMEIEKINYLYNMADGVILISSNEGWGLSVTEGMLCGKMFIGNVTGGIQDQMRFEDENGNWIDFNEDFCSNHFGTYKKCGSWALPVFPSNLSLVGSVPTPYIFDDRADFRDIAKNIEILYNIPKEERIKRGLEGKTWATGDEARMTVNHMCGTFIEVMDETFKDWKPRSRYELLKVEDYPKKHLTHKLVY